MLYFLEFRDSPKDPREDMFVGIPIFRKTINNVLPKIHRLRGAKIIYLGGLRLKC